eukprot:GHVO01011310.1.p1 GENE.GHVO01011310.1~~GHVO01011310.1.p1  ORF type:complete len:402 (+),score=75.97 GHVO01011310.1:3-1208(+)
METMEMEPMEMETMEMETMEMETMEDGEDAPPPMMMDEEEEETAADSIEPTEATVEKEEDEEGAVEIRPENGEAEFNPDIEEDHDPNRLTFGEGQEQLNIEEQTHENMSNSDPVDTNTGTDDQELFVSPSAYHTEMNHDMQEESIADPIIEERENRSIMFSPIRASFGLGHEEDSTVMKDVQITEEPPMAENDYEGGNDENQENVPVEYDQKAQQKLVDDSVQKCAPEAESGTKSEPVSPEYTAPTVDPSVHIKTADNYSKPRTPKSFTRLAQKEGARTPIFNPQQLKDLVGAEKRQRLLEKMGEKDRAVEERLEQSRKRQLQSQEERRAMAEIKMRQAQERRQKLEQEEQRKRQEKLKLRRPLTPGPHASAISPRVPLTTGRSPIRTLKPPILQQAFPIR